MYLEMNTLSAFDKNQNIVKTWNYEVVTSKEGSLAKIRTTCDEKGYTLRVCFNDDKAVEAYADAKLNTDLNNL